MKKNDIQDKYSNHLDDFDFILDSYNATVDKINSLGVPGYSCKKDLITLLNTPQMTTASVHCNSKLEYFALTLAIAKCSNRVDKRKVKHKFESKEKSYELIQSIRGKIPIQKTLYNDSEIEIISQILPRIKTKESVAYNFLFDKNDDSEEFDTKMFFYQIGNIHASSLTSKLCSYQNYLLKKKLLDCWGVNLNSVLKRSFLEPHDYYAAASNSKPEVAEGSALTLLYKKDYRDKFLLEIDFIFDLYKKLNEHYKIFTQQGIDSQKDIIKFALREFKVAQKKEHEIEISGMPKLFPVLKFFKSIVLIYAIYLKTEWLSSDYKKINTLITKFSEDIHQDLSDKEIALLHLPSQGTPLRTRSHEKIKKENEQSLHELNALEHRSVEQEILMQYNKEILQNYNSLMNKLAKKEIIKHIPQLGLLDDIAVIQEMNTLSCSLGNAGAQNKDVAAKKPSKI